MDESNEVDEIERIQQEIESLLAEDLEEKPKVDYAAALKEKNRKIKEYKQKLEELEAKLNSAPPPEGDTNAGDTDTAESVKPPVGKQDVASQNANSQNATQPAIDESVKSSDETSEFSEEELKETIKQITDYCDELENKYQDSDYPFSRAEVLLEIQKMTDGHIKDLSIIENTYLALRHKKQEEIQKARENASTMITSTGGGGKEYSPQNLDEAFNMIKKK